MTRIEAVWFSLDSNVYCTLVGCTNLILMPHHHHYFYGLLDTDACQCSLREEPTTKQF